MLPQILLAKWFKSYVLPKVLDHMLQVFKLDKVLNYVEKENDADRKIKDLQNEVDSLKVWKINLEDKLEKQKNEKS
tara:strand:- start:1187 stop:1414 length:228 start_codon:yes stop_codon:yes gene_type:complete